MIKILITGGTFHKSYDSINDVLFFEKTHIPEMLKRSKCKLSVKVETLMMKDSLKMDKNDVDKIIDACKREKK